MSPIRYEPDERCPPQVALLAALQIFVPNTVGLVLLAALVVQASGESDAYLSWVVFTALTVSGAGMVLHAFRFRYLGSGRLVVTNFNVPFLAICALALQTGGPRLLATLLVTSTLLQFVLTLRLAALRRVFTQTVSGVVVMLVAVSAVPFIVSAAVVPPEGASTLHFLAPGIVASVVGAVISLQGTPAWRMWVLPAMVAAGLAVAAPLGYYDTASIIAAPWASLPDFGWPGLDLTFGADFWALLPAFVFVNLTAFVKALGDLSVTFRASYRDARAVDFRSVQGGLGVYGLTTLLSGLLGTLPFAAPWSATAIYIGFIGVAATSVGIYLGLLTMLIAPFSKLLALLVAIPSPVVGAVYVVIFGMLFIEGAKTVFTGRIDQRKATVAGVSMVLGMSAGAFSGFAEGVTGELVGNTLFVGGMAAVSMTLFTELANMRSPKLRVDLAESSLPAVDELLHRFARKHSWSEEGEQRLRLVGEEVVLSLLADESGAPDGERRRMALSVHSEGGDAELEIVVAADDASEENIEKRIAYLDEGTALEDEQELSTRILRHYASSVHHRKYYGIDVVSCHVER